MAEGEAPASVRGQLMRDRRTLLDLSTRNRLRNVPLKTTRVRTIEVVGDERQLPPTRFFAKLTSDLDDEPEDEDNALATADVESILDLCLGPRRAAPDAELALPVQAPIADRGVQPAVLREQATCPTPLGR